MKVKRVGVEVDSMQCRARRNSGVVAWQPAGSGEAGTWWGSSPAAVVRGRSEGGEKASERRKKLRRPRSPIDSRGGVTGALVRLLRSVGRICCGLISLWPCEGPCISDTWGVTELQPLPGFAAPACEEFKEMRITE